MPFRIVELQKIMKQSITLFIIVLLLSACGTSSYVRSPRYRVGGGTSDSGDKPKDSRIVIYRANAELAVSNVDTVNSRLTELAKKYSGYVVVLGNRQSTIRVKANYLDKAFEDVLRFGKVKRKIVSGQDVTEEYNDYAVRLENANKARQRYLELLAKAENVEAALKVEKELERLNGDIDLMTGKLNRLTHLADYSTIEVEMTEKKQIGVLGYVGIGFYKAVRWLFVRN